jgi:hypothetical protein
VAQLRAIERQRNSMFDDWLLMDPAWKRRVMAGVVVATMIGCVPAPTGRVTPEPGAPDETAVETPAGSDVPNAAGGPSPSPSFVRPTPNPSPTFLVYEVQPGDTLTSIARLFGTTARSIAYWNRARYPSLDPDSSTYEPNRIVVGWTLQLIPTAIVDEDELPDPTPAPTASSMPSSLPEASANPS